MEESGVKVSIVSGVYNAEKHIEKCILSMINQSYHNIEIILVVNASVDSSQECVEKYERKYPERIKAFYTDEKLGAGGSRQYGMLHATGDYICFVDCDDELEKHFVSNMLSQIEGNCKTDIVIGNFKKVDLQGKTLYKRMFKNEKQALIQSVAPWGKLFRRNFLERNSLTFINVPFGEDIIFSSEVFLTYPKVKLCNYIGYNWLDNPVSTSHTELRGFPQNVIEKSVECFEQLYDKYPQQRDVLNYFRYKYYVWYLLQSGRNVRKADMKREYECAFAYINSQKNGHKGVLRGILKLKGERVCVKVVLLSVLFLERIGCAKLFFSFYSQSFLGNFWPSL